MCEPVAACESQSDCLKETPTQKRRRRKSKSGPFKETPTQKRRHGKSKSGPFKETPTQKRERLRIKASLKTLVAEHAASGDKGSPGVQQVQAVDDSTKSPPVPLIKDNKAVSANTKISTVEAANSNANISAQPVTTVEAAANKQGADKLNHHLAKGPGKQCPIQGCEFRKAVHGRHFAASHLPKILCESEFSLADEEPPLDKYFTDVDQAFHFLADLVGCSSLEELVLLGLEDGNPLQFNTTPETLVVMTKYASYKGWNVPISNSKKKSKRNWFLSKSPTLLLAKPTLVPIINRLSRSQRRQFVKWDPPATTAPSPPGRGTSERRALAL